MKGQPQLWKKCQILEGMFLGGMCVADLGISWGVSSGKGAVRYGCVAMQL